MIFKDIVNELGKKYNLRMFLGTAKSTCNGKNQIVLPSKFKKQTGSQLFITNWFEHTIVILPVDVGKQIMKILTTDAVALLPEGRRLERFLYGGAEEVTVNSEGRFTLPHHLKTHALIQKDVVFRGVGERIELWSNESYERYAFLTDEETRKTAITLFNAIKNGK